MDSDIWLPLVTLILGWAGAQVTEKFRDRRTTAGNKWLGVPSYSERRCWSYRTRSLICGWGSSEAWTTKPGSMSKDLGNTWRRPPETLRPLVDG